MRLRLLFVSSFIFFVFAACGGKVVLDSSGGTGTGGAGGNAACSDFCGAVQSAGCSSTIPDCSTTCLSAFATGGCQSQIVTALECAAAALAQSGDCADAALAPGCAQEEAAVSACESSTGIGGTVSTSGVGALGAGG